MKKASKNIIKEETQQGPSYDEVWLKDKLGNPTKDKYEFDDNRGHIDIYPDLGDMRAERSSQFIRFKLDKGEVHFVHAFGYERGYDMLKSALPELAPMSDSSFAGFMNVNTDGGTIPVGIDTANKMIDALRRGLDAEAGAQSDFYGSRGPTSGTIDEQKLRKLIRKVIKENLEQGYTLDELTFNVVRQFFPAQKEVSFPYPNDSSRLVRNERDLEDWKSETKNRFGNVRVFFDPNAVWYDQVQIKDEKFNKDKETSIQGKAAFLDRERKAGRTTGLDEDIKVKDNTEFKLSLKHLLDKHVTKGGEIEEDMNINEVLALEIDEDLTEAKFKGKTVKLNKPMRGDSKKFKVYVANGKNKDGSIKVKKVNFGHGGTSAKKRGEKTLKIRKSNPKARKAFRARHRCDTPGPKTMARYWSCKKW